MEIEAYDRCHIGIKLKPIVDLNILKEKIEKILPEHGYKPVSEAFVDAESRVIKKGVIGAKENTNVELNYVAHALNTVGKEPTSVLNIFKEVTQFLSDIGYDPKAIVLFYEVLTNMNMKSNKNPRDILSKSSKIDLSPLEDIEDIGVTGVLISNKEEAQEYELFSLIIEPNPTSPRNRFAVRLQYRSRDTGDIISFQESLEDKITKIIQSIEGE
ncbi:MAG: hypothetical protein B6U72_04535 [Candidatus Altiarchaeales archaeon ex4484_2]|nr:MAG: hypothetical protein B6U72_04535 [Candidatus Altiarchaeales archaeon ex4484_2]